MKRYKNIVASYLILIKNGKILLSKRQNTGYEDNKYGLIAGHVEKKESFTDCIIREAKEEINIDIVKKDLHFTHIFHSYSPEDKNERVNVFFVCEKWKGEIINNEPDKCENLKWCDINNLPSNTIELIRKAIKNSFDKKYYCENGF